MSAEPGLGPLADVDFQRIGAQHVMDVPSEASAEALQDDLVGLLALLVGKPAFTRIFRDAGKARCNGHGDLGRLAEGAETHWGNHDRHAQFQGLGPVLVADRGF